MNELAPVKGMLGIARKAGAVIAGTDLVRDAVRKKKALMVLASLDISLNTEKRLRNCCDCYGVPFISLPLSMSELSGATGFSRLTSAVAVTDKNIRDGLVRAIEKIQKINLNDKTSIVSGSIQEVRNIGSKQHKI